VIVAEKNEISRQLIVIFLFQSQCRTLNSVRKYKICAVTGEKWPEIQKNLNRKKWSHSRKMAIPLWPKKWYPKVVSYPNKPQWSGIGPIILIKRVRIFSTRRCWRRNQICLKIKRPWKRRENQISKLVRQCFLSIL
jgi:hypothetical protein